MLTADLVRATVRKGVLKPRYIDPESEELRGEAERLVAIFEGHVGERVGDLDEAIADHIGDSTGYLIQRGLAHLLMKRATTEVAAALPPEEVRAAVFRLAAERWPVAPGPSRDAVLAAAGEELGLTPEEVEAALYADLKREVRIAAFDSLDADALLARYNLALAQSMLMRARRVTVTLPGVEAKRARQLFRIIKFHRLMHRATRTADSFQVELDGPLSLFRHTTRYGLKLAKFLPGLCHCRQWALTADVSWGEPKRDLVFEADQDTGLVTHTRDQGTWESDEERHFRTTFKKLKTDWTLRRGARVIDLGGEGVLVPDYTVHHPDGRVALLDIVWFWRARTFQRRLELLSAKGPSHLVIALATRYNTDEKAPELESGAIYPFKGVIGPKPLLALIEQVAIAERGASE